MKSPACFLLALVLTPLFAMAETPVVQDVPERLDLPNALAYALDNNYAIRAARERIREQDGLLIETRAANLPGVSLNGGYAVTDRGLNESFGPGTPALADESWRLAINLRQNLYSGGGVRASLESQRLGRDAALLELQSVIEAVLLEVRVRYFSVLLERERIGVQEESVAVLTRQLENARNRFDAGSISQFEVLRAEVELANAQPPLIRARNQYRIAIDELRRVLGFDHRTPGNVRKVPEFLGELAYVPVDYALESSLDRALARRPELTRLQRLAESAESAVVSARAGRLPVVDAVAGYQMRSSQFSSRLDDAREGWQVGVEANWAIFDGRRTSGREAQARSRLNQTRLLGDEQRLEVEVEVRRAHSSLQEASELAAAARRVVAQAVEALRLSESRYSAGSATQLDVLQARVSLTQARTNQLEANYSHMVAVATLRRVIGEAEVFTLETSS